REKLLAIGVDRKIGEILVTRKLISQDVAEEISNQQKTVDSGAGESVLGRLAVQNGLISQPQLNRALELQRAWFQESGVAPTLGYILVEEGLLTVQQLDALIAVQNRVKTRRRPIGGQGGAGTGASGGAAAGGAGAAPSALSSGIYEPGDSADTGARAAVNYHVRTQGTASDGSRVSTERVMTGAALRAMIRKGEIGPSVLARREDQTAVRPLGDFAEFTTAFEQNDRYRTATVRRTKAVARRRGSRVMQRLGMITLLTLVIAAAFWFGRQSGPGAGGRSPSRAVWTAGDLLRYLPENAADSVAARVWVDRMQRHESPGDADEVRQFMERLGLERIITLTGQTCYVPLDEAAMLREWAQRGSAVDPRLQPVELPDGVIVGVPETDGVRMADGRLLSLDRGRLRQQVSTWQALIGARAAIMPDQPVREQVRRHLDAAARLDESGWYRHARRERLAAWEVLPEDRRVRDQLGFIAPGEDLNDPTGSRVLPQHELPSVPMPDPPLQRIPPPWTAPGMAGTAADPAPKSPPWVELMPLLGLEDVFPAPEPVPDPEANRYRDGTVQYLGYWLPKGPFERWWPTARHPSRLVLRTSSSGSAEVWTDLPQFRQDILVLVRDLYPRTIEYLRLHLKDVLPGAKPGVIDETRVPRTLLSVPCCLVVVGPGERLPLWVARGVNGPATRVELTDMRSPDALILPIARGCFSAFISASWGSGLPAWMREAMAAELADRFASDNLLDEWRLIENTLQVERLLAPLPGTPGTDPLPALFAGDCRTAAEKAMARSVYRDLLTRAREHNGTRLARLHDAVLADDRIALEDETRRLVQGIDGTPWPVRVRQIALDRSDALIAALQLHAANTRFLSPAHLEVLDRPNGRLRFYCNVCGFAAAESGRQASDGDVPGAIASGYSLRELLGLAALAARLRVITLAGPSAPDAMRELRALFQATGRADWSAATTSGLDRLPPDDPDRRTGSGAEEGGGRHD
ncbi:MAG: hypothetical protein AB7S36_14975, partial [Planctomycetota bacterium]